MAFDPCDVCGGCIPANIDQRLFHQMALVALCDIVAAIEGGGGIADNVNIAAYGGVATTLGQKLMAASIPVVIASDQSAISVTEAPATLGAEVVGFTSTSGAGATTASIYSVSIANVGGAAGVLGGVAFEAGGVVNISAVEDPITGVFKKVPAIAYDATGTTFRIVEVS